MKDFNKERLFANIAHLLDKSDMKIGEFEAASGVHAGYVSRTSKDEKSKPGIEFVVKAAQALQVSIDVLLKVDLIGLTETEKYLQRFLEKAQNDTLEGKLDWDRETQDSLGMVDEEDLDKFKHPLLTVKEFKHYYDMDEFDIEYWPVMRSRAFGCNTIINGDCFNLHLKGNVVLYIMNICESNLGAEEKKVHGKEIWTYTPDEEPQYLCSTFKGDPLADLVESLYATVAEFSKHPRISKGLQNAIDAFMEDDL